MSGRKRGEVVAVLADAARMKYALFSGNLDYCEQLLRELRELERRARQQGGEGVDRVESAETLEKGLKTVRTNLDRLGGEMQGLEARLAQRADGNHYFDAEYAEAERLERDYKGLQKEVKSLQRRLEKAKTDQQLALKQIQDQQEREQEQARIALVALQQKVAACSFPDPTDPDRQLGAEAFCSDVLRDPARYHRVADELAVAERFLTGGQFAEALARLDALSTEWDGLSGDLERQSEALIRQVQTALAIAEALENDGSKVETELMGATVGEGLRVYTVNTSYPVEFTVSAADDGEGGAGQGGGNPKLEFNIDSLGTDCGTNTRDLQEKLRRRGLHFEITDWGKGEPPSESQQARRQERLKE